MTVLDCAMVQTFCKNYFNRSISDSIKDLLLAHIIKCKICQKHFKKYAKEIAVDFDIKKDAANFIKNSKSSIRCSKTKEVFIDVYGQAELDKTKVSWEYYADTFDLPKLMNLQCVNEFSNEEKFEVDPTDQNAIDCYVEYGKYITKKMCKNIDLLEKCFDMEVKKDA